MKPETIEELRRQRDEYKAAAYRLENTIRLLRTEGQNVREALESIIDSARDGREIPEWLDERLTEFELAAQTDGGKE